MRVQGYKNGEVTAFLALVFALLVAFTGGLMESASIQAAKGYRRADMNRAIESVFAEYQRELLEEYELFSLDSTYETGNYGEEQILRRLEFYEAVGMEHRIEKIQLLTDHEGEAFQDQVAKYMIEKYGIASLGEWSSQQEEWEQKEEDSEKLGEQGSSIENEVNQILAESEVELPVEDNPFLHLNQMINGSIVNLVLPRNGQISENAVELASLPSHRELKKGYGVFEQAEKPSDISRVALGEYILTHCLNALEEEEIHAGLNYQVEYILTGKSNDRENLEAILRKIMMFRFLPNYTCLMTDMERQEEARIFATTICISVVLPVATEAVTQLILLSWAFGESIMDLRSLMKGYKVPVGKTKEQWQLSLSGLMNIGKEEFSEGANQGEGMDYRDYLRILLLLKNKGEVSIRTLDVIEQQLRLEKECSWFRVDACVNRMEVQSTAKLRRGITYQFRTYFGYR